MIDRHNMMANTVLLTDRRACDDGLCDSEDCHSLPASPVTAVVGVSLPARAQRTGRWIRWRFGGQRRGCSVRPDSQCCGGSAASPGVAARADRFGAADVAELRSCSVVL